jgi:hypothetical protein
MLSAVIIEVIVLIPKNAVAYYSPTRDLPIIALIADSKQVGARVNF